jgi:hypothetical protein
MGWTNEEFNQDDAAAIVYAATLATTAEAVKTPAPDSRVRTPSGGRQPETRVEFATRIATTAVMYLLEMGLVAIPPDIADRLDKPLPPKRVVPVGRPDSP